MRLWYSPGMKLRMTGSNPLTNDFVVLVPYARSICAVQIKILVHHPTFPQFLITSQRIILPRHVPTSYLPYIPSSCLPYIPTSYLPYIPTSYLPYIDLVYIPHIIFYYLPNVTHRLGYLRNIPRDRLISAAAVFVADDLPGSVLEVKVVAEKFVGFQDAAEEDGEKEENEKYKEHDEGEHLGVGVTVQSPPYNVSNDNQREDENNGCVGFDERRDLASRPLRNKKLHFHLQF